MSKHDGPIVFTVSPEMAKSMKVFRAGETYVAHRATAVVGVGEGTSTRTPPKKKAAKKKVAKKTTKKKVTKKASKRKPKTKKAPSKKKSTPKKKTKKKVTKKASKPKALKKKTVKPDIIVKFVRENEGCNMTDIEASTKMPQAAIRRVLNQEREKGSIRTEGQRRGLRYFIGKSSPEPVAAAASSDDGDGEEAPW